MPFGAPASASAERTALSAASRLGWMSKVASRRVISNRRSTVGLVHTSAMRPRWRVTRRSPLSSTDRPVESMNSTALRSSTTAVLPRLTASSSRTLKRGAVETWISPAIAMMCVRSSRSSSESSNWGSANATDACLPDREGGCQTERVRRGGVEAAAAVCSNGRTSVPSSVRT